MDTSYSNFSFVKSNMSQTMKQNQQTYHPRIISHEIHSQNSISELVTPFYIDYDRQNNNNTISEDGYMQQYSDLKMRKSQSNLFNHDQKNFDQNNQDLFSYLQKENSLTQQKSKKNKFFQRRHKMRQSFEDENLMENTLETQTQKYEAYNYSQKDRSRVTVEVQDFMEVKPVRPVYQTKTIDKLGYNDHQKAQKLVNHQIAEDLVAIKQDGEAVSSETKQGKLGICSKCARKSFRAVQSTVCALVAEFTMVPMLETNEVLVENLNMKIKSEESFTLSSALKVIYNFKSKIPIDQGLLNQQSEIKKSLQTFRPMEPYQDPASREQSPNLETSISLPQDLNVFQIPKEDLNSIMAESPQQKQPQQPQMAKLSFIQAQAEQVLNEIDELSSYRSLQKNHVQLQQQQNVLEVQGEKGQETIENTQLESVTSIDKNEKQENQLLMAVINQKLDQEIPQEKVVTETEQESPAKQKKISIEYTKYSVDIIPQEEGEGFTQNQQILPDKIKKIGFKSLGSKVMEENAGDSFLKVGAALLKQKNDSKKDMLTSSKTLQNVFGTGEEKGIMAKILEAKEGEGKSSLNQRMKSRLMKATKQKLVNDVESNIRQVIKQRTNELKQQLQSIPDDEGKLKVFSDYIERKHIEEKELRLKESVQNHLHIDQCLEDTCQQDQVALLEKLKLEFNLPDPEEDAKRRKSIRQRAQKAKEEAERKKKEDQDAKMANFVPKGHVNVDEIRASERAEKKRKMRQNQELSKSSEIPLHLQKTLEKYRDAKNQFKIV